MILGAHSVAFSPVYRAGQILQVPWDVQAGNAIPILRDSSQWNDVIDIMTSGARDIDCAQRRPISPRWRGDTDVVLVHSRVEMVRRGIFRVLLATAFAGPLRIGGDPSSIYFAAFLWVLIVPAAIVGKRLFDVGLSPATVAVPGLLSIACDPVALTFVLSEALFLSLLSVATASPKSLFCASFFFGKHGFRPSGSIGHKRPDNGMGNCIYGGAGRKPFGSA
jgi:hypothetical protein